MYRLTTEVFKTDGSSMVQVYGLYRDRNNAEDRAMELRDYDDVSVYVEPTTDFTADQWADAMDNWKYDE